MSLRKYVLIWGSEFILQLDMIESLLFTKVWNTVLNWIKYEAAGCEEVVVNIEYNFTNKTPNIL